MLRSPQDIYARNLISSRGYPLWSPDPSQQFLRHRREGLRIGDVGVVIPEDGCFDVFFNACLPQDHAFHRATGVPVNFQHVALDDMDTRTTIDAENPGCVLRNSSVKRCRATARSTPGSSGLEYDFVLSSSEGALLILPEGAQRHDLRNHQRFLEAAKQQGASWYRFAHEKIGQIISYDTLYLITGLYQTTSWSVAAFERTTENIEYPAQFRVSQVGRSDITTACSWETERALNWRSGPRQQNGFANQSIFIRGFKIALRTRMLGTRWISVTTDAPSTRPNPARAFGAVPGESWLANMFGGLSVDSIAQPSGSGLQDEITAKSASDVTRDGIQNRSAVAIGENVIIQRIPEVSKAFHPSDIINQYLLTKEPSANIAITHDDDWIAMLEENLLQPEDLVKEGCLERILSQAYDIISREGAVYLQRRRVRETWEDATALSSVPYDSSSETDVTFYSPLSSPESLAHSLPAHITDHPSWARATRARMGYPYSPSPPFSTAPSTPSLTSGYDTPITIPSPGSPLSPTIAPNHMDYFECRSASSSTSPQLRGVHTTLTPCKPFSRSAHTVVDGRMPQSRPGGQPAIQASSDIRGRSVSLKGALHVSSQMTPPARAMPRSTLAGGRLETGYNTFSQASIGITAQAPAPFAPAATASPMHSGIRHPTHDKYVPSRAPVNLPRNAGGTVQALPTDGTDSMAFIEGQQYGPVLEPVSERIVGVTIELNPLLAPPRDVQDDHLHWNMLFPASNCHRTTEPQRPWLNGRNAPATHPRLTYIVMISRSFPWMIHAYAKDCKAGVTCGEVLDAISTCLAGEVSNSEYENLPLATKQQIWENYRINRSTNSGGRLAEGPKRVDWLGSASNFGGLVSNEAFVREYCGKVSPCTFELICRA